MGGADVSRFQGVGTRIQGPEPSPAQCESPPALGQGMFLVSHKRESLLSRALLFNLFQLMCTRP